MIPFSNFLFALFEIPFLQDPPDVPTGSVTEFLGWTVGILILVILALVRYIIAEQERCRERAEKAKQREAGVLKLVLKNQEDTNRAIESLNERLQFAEQLERALDRLEGER